MEKSVYFIIDRRIEKKEFPLAVMLGRFKVLSNGILAPLQLVRHGNKFADFCSCSQSASNTKGKRLSAE